MVRAKWDYRSRLNAVQANTIKQAVTRTQWEAKRNWRIKA